MSWTIDEILRDWLVGGTIAVPPDEVVAAFERCQRLLGRNWITKSRDTSWGAAPTLRVVTTGQRLASLDGVAATEALIEKLADGDPSAEAELHAIHLLRSAGETTVELFPRVIVSAGRERVPDLRIRRDQEPWLYVEVTRPDASEAFDRTVAAIDALSTSIIESIDKRFDIEVYLQRDPTDAEFGQIGAAVGKLCRGSDSAREELSDGLGLLLLSTDPSGPVVPTDHDGWKRARLGFAKVWGEHGVTTRRVVVRLPFSDERAEKFLHREASQLPEGELGLVMIDVGKAINAFSSWEPLINRRFQPAVHTRVGAVALFASRTVLLDGQGFADTSEAKFVPNLHARHPLPAWIEPALIPDRRDQS